MKGETEMAEMNWIQEYFYNEACDKVRNEGIAIGETRGEVRGKELALNAALDFMRLNGLSNEQINNFKNSMLNN